MKWCPDCKRELPESVFTRNRRMKDGLAFYCRDCASVRLLASKRHRLGPPRTRHSRGPKNVPLGYKWCPECDKVKPTDLFPRNRAQRSGIGSYCKPCHNRITRENKDQHGGARNYHLRRRYGITVEHFDAMFAEQDGVCAICREAPAEHVDHDHLTSRVRGLLCFNCNGALGQFRDRPDLMLRAVLYLQRDSDRPPLGDFGELGLGVVIADFSQGRPADEPEVA